MAGIAVFQSTSDGKPQSTSNDHDMADTESVPNSSAFISGSKSQLTLAEVELPDVSVSPQGKGVGVFGLEGSPGVSGIKNEGPLKDPKVQYMDITCACTCTLLKNYKQM